MNNKDKEIKTFVPQRIYEVVVSKELKIHGENEYINVGEQHLVMDRSVLVVGHTAQEIIELIGEDYIISIKRVNTSALTTK